MTSCGVLTRRQGIAGGKKGPLPVWGGMHQYPLEMLSTCENGNALTAVARSVAFFACRRRHTDMPFVGSGPIHVQVLRPARRGRYPRPTLDAPLARTVPPQAVCDARPLYLLTIHRSACVLKPRITYNYKRTLILEIFHEPTLPEE